MYVCVCACMCMYVYVCVCIYIYIATINCWCWCDRKVSWRKLKAPSAIQHVEMCSEDAVWISWFRRTAIMWPHWLISVALWMALWWVGWSTAVSAAYRPSAQIAIALCFENIEHLLHESRPTLPKWCLQTMSGACGRRLEGGIQWCHVPSLTPVLYFVVCIWAVYVKFMCHCAGRESSFSSCTSTFSACPQLRYSWLLLDGDIWFAEAGVLV